MPKYVARKIIRTMAVFALPLLVFYILDLGKIRENGVGYFFVFFLLISVQEIWNHRITKLVFDTERKLLILTTRQFLYPEDEEQIPFDKAAFVYSSPTHFYVLSGKREAGNFICEKTLLPPEQKQALLDRARELSITVKC